MTDLNDDELREAIELLYFGYRSFTAGPDEILAERGLGRVHHRILYFVGRNDDVSVSDLLGILCVSKQALNAPLRRLIQLDLVSATLANHDRRVKQLRLTVNGRRLERRLTGTQMKQLAAVFEQTSRDTIDQWRAIMLRLSQ